MSCDKERTLTFRGEIPVALSWRSKKANIQDEGCRKAAPKENEFSRISSFWARTGTSRSVLSSWRLKKYRKSTKAATKPVGRRENRKRISSLFRNEAILEQLGAEQAEMEQFEEGATRASSIKDAQFELISVKGRALHICWAVELSVCRRWSISSLGERTWL